MAFRFGEKTRPAARTRRAGGRQRQHRAQPARHAPRTRRRLRLGNRLPRCHQPRPCRAGQRHAGALRTAGGSRRALRAVARTLPAAALHRRAARTAGRY